MQANTFPVRPEIKLPDMSVESLTNTALPVDDNRLLSEKDDMLAKFDSIMKKK